MSLPIAMEKPSSFHFIIHNTGFVEGEGFSKPLGQTRYYFHSGCQDRCPLQSRCKESAIHLRVESSFIVMTSPITSELNDHHQLRLSLSYGHRGVIEVT